VTERTFGGAEPAPDPDAVVRTKLYLSWLRSVAAVQQGLLEMYPEEADWAAVLEDEAFGAEIEGFADVVRQMRLLGAVGRSLDLEQLQATGAAHYAAAVEALRATAERLGVGVDDLIVVLVHA
jgi:hypothetical protein